MPTVFNAKDISEEALKEIGAFSVVRAQADANELKRTLIRLEMMLSHSAAAALMAGISDTLDIPLVNGVTAYKLNDITTATGFSRAFSAYLVDTTTGRVLDPVDIITEDQFNGCDRSATGRTTAIYFRSDVEPIARVYPKPTTGDAIYAVRVRYQTYFAPDFDDSKDGIKPLRLREGWYLWAVTQLAYLIGRGPVRRLDDSELTRLQNDADRYWMELSVGEGRERNDLCETTEGWGDI